MATTPVHALPLPGAGAVPLKNAVKKGMAKIDGLLPPPFVVGDIGKVLKVASDGEGGAMLVWAADAT